MNTPPQPTPEQLHQRIAELEKREKELAAMVRVLRAGLVNYAIHSEGCEGKPCTCGLINLLFEKDPPAALRELLSGAIGLLSEADKANTHGDNVLLSPDWFSRAKAEKARLEKLAGGGK